MTNNAKGAPQVMPHRLAALGKLVTRRQEPLLELRQLRERRRLGHVAELFGRFGLLELVQGKCSRDLAAAKGHLDEICNHADQHLGDNEVLPRAQQSRLRSASPHDCTRLRHDRAVIQGADRKLAIGRRRLQVLPTVLLPGRRCRKHSQTRNSLSAWGLWHAGEFEERGGKPRDWEQKHNLAKVVRERAHRHRLPLVFCAPDLHHADGRHNCRLEREIRKGLDLHTRSSVRAELVSNPTENTILAITMASIRTWLAITMAFIKSPLNCANQRRCGIYPRAHAQTNALACMCGGREVYLGCVHDR
jgi:hypothetical protein